MKKGFTLVELVSVLVVLAVIALIALPAVATSIDESKQKAYNSQVDIILESARKWAVDNNDLLPIDNSVYQLTLSKLISEQYISNTEDGKLKNPLDSKTYMNGCVNISFSETYNQYIYEYKEEC